ncbi:hypothetical protein SK128_003040, partial [Halocaridina rubra]
KEVEMTETREVMRNARNASAAMESTNQGSVQRMDRHARNVKGRTIMYECARRKSIVSKGKSILIMMSSSSQSTHSEMSKW